MKKYYLLMTLALLLISCGEEKTEIVIKNQLDGIKIESVRFDGTVIATDIWPSGEDGTTIVGSNSDIFDAKAPLRITLKGAIGEIQVETVDTIEFEYKNDTTIVIGDSTKLRNNM
jgi:hypothetical protein